MSISFDYGIVPVKALSVTEAKDTKGKNFIKTVNVGDQSFAPTKRFWQSIQMRFRFSDNIFKYFKPEEIFERISKVNANDKIRYCVEKTSNSEGVQTRKMLGVTNPTRPIINYNTLENVLKDYQAKSINYANGYIRSTHPLSDTSVQKIKIAGDTFEQQFVSDIPVDGFGKPSIYLSMLREVCSNGMVAYSPAFRSELSIGKKDDNVEFSLRRALDSYNNEEGFQALTDRITSAHMSWASVNEALALQNVVQKLYTNKLLKLDVLSIGNSSSGDAVMNGLYRCIGDLNQLYGLSNLDALSVKKQKTLPAKCKVIDLVNFATEIATHKAAPAGNRMLQAYAGTLLSNEYDLEGTAEKFTDHRDFFIANSDTAQTLAEMS